MIVGIYSIEQGGRLYIGRATNLEKRKRRHLAMLRAGTHDNVKLQRAFDRHGEAAFTLKTVLICDPRDLELYEQRLMDGYDVCRKGFNIAPKSGAAMAGRKNTPESNAKRSAALKGRPKSPETRAKLSAALTGKAHDPARVARMQERLRDPAMREAIAERMRGNTNGAGQVLSDERRAHLRAARTPEQIAALVAMSRTPERREAARRRWLENNPRKRA